MFIKGESMSIRILAALCLMFCCVVIHMLASLLFALSTTFPTHGNGRFLPRMSGLSGSEYALMVSFDSSEATE